MRRRLALLVVPALALSACGGTPTGDAAQRVAFLKRADVRKLHDDELAKLCPSLYPSDFLSRSKHYHYTRTKNQQAFTSAQTAAAKAAGCTSRGTTPK